MGAEQQQNEEIDTQAILDGIEAPSADRPMSAPEQPAAEQQQPAPAPTWNGEEYAFDWNGKRIIPDSADKLRTWASLGHNYSQRAAELNRREAEFKAFEAKFKPYAEVDDYATKNPEWWEHVQKSYAARGQQVPETVGELDPKLQAALKPLQEKLSQFDQFLQAQQQEKAIQEQSRQDEALSAEIESIREKYPNIDLNARDESGQTLEYRVMAHAQEQGISTFRAAFRDYLHDQLIESAKANAQTAQAKAGEHEKRQGVLGRSPTPKKAPDDAPGYVRGQSYDQITQNVYRELGIA